MSQLEDAVDGVASELDALGPAWRSTIVMNEPGVERRPGVVRLLLGLARVAAAGNDLDLDAAAALAELEAAALAMASTERRAVIGELYSAAIPLPPEWERYANAIARLLAAAEAATTDEPQGD